jgi:predicted PolB exonuclease-like 3'-5' exonuclease
MIAFLDIETVCDIPDEHMPTVRHLAERTHRGPEPFDDEDFRKFVATSPWLARIVCVGLILRKDDDSEIERAYVGTEESILTRTAKALEEAWRIVTFNGRGFDLPLLVNAYRRNQMDCPDAVSSAWQEYRFKPDRGFDVSDIITGFGATKRPSLAEACIGLGLPNPKVDGDGSDVGELVRNGEFERLKAYCLSDVRATKGLYDVVLHTPKRRKVMTEAPPIELNECPF